MSAPSFDEPLPFESVLPRPGLLNALTAGTLVGLIVVQVAYWPAIFGSLLPSLTVAVATPLLAFVPSGMIVAALRRHELRRWSAAHGFTFHRRPGWAVPQYDVAPFNVKRARRRRITDAMTGMVGVHPAWQFHYRWLNNNRVNVSTHQRSVFALVLPRALPPLTVGPTISSDAGDTVAFESIDFNDYWSVRSPDARYAKAVITTTTMSRLLELDVPVTGNTRIVIVGRELLAISIGGNRGSDVTRLFTALRIIADGIPSYVWDEWADDSWEVAS